MKTVVQRVSEARVSVDGKVVGEISHGMLVLLGFAPEDSMDDLNWMINKLINLRIFKDNENKMNLSVQDIKGSILIVSQFTLYGDSKKGNRPSFVSAAGPEIAIPLYNSFISSLKDSFSGKVETGIFGADMKVSLINDGPVTLIIESP